MNKTRGKNLDDDGIALIVGMLDGWSGKLTWDLLIEAIQKRLCVRYTRQALDKRARIKIAYQVTKARISKINTSKYRRKLSAAELDAFIQRTNRLEAENVRLRAENERLLEQYVTWAYNAYLKGLTKEYLNTPLAGVDREITKLHLL